MISGRFSAAYRQIETLNRAGALGQLDDSNLLQRFLAGNEAAFEVLIARHGPMVQSVCRSVIGTGDGVEDAFQATFLVLVRRANSIRKPESLGPWLHGVARRIALRNRRDAERQRKRERERSESFRVVRIDEREETLHATLHDEIARLPEKYRIPIVMCDLEGRSHAEAAESLHWPIGSVSGRLCRARALLRTRIVRRGLALSAGLFAVESLATQARAAISPETIARAARIAMIPRGSPGIPAKVLKLASPYLKSRLGLIAQGAVGLMLATGWAVTPGHRIEAPAGKTEAIVVSEPRPLRDLTDEKEITSLAVAPDGSVVASGSRNALVTLWDLRTGLELATLRGHGAAVVSLAFTPDGTMLASAAEDRTVLLWNLAARKDAEAITFLQLNPENSPLDHGPESPDSGRGGTGRDRCADGPARIAGPAGA